MAATASRARNGVFISYSRHDGEAFAHDLRRELEARHVSLWQDRTGMEGGRDWWEQIREALNTVEYMVLVMTSAALASPIVRKEWRYARQQGVCIYPVIAGTADAIGALPRWMRDVHWYDLAHQREKFFNDLNTRCQMQRVPFMVEDLPDDFVPRAAEFDQLKRALLDGNLEEPVAITAALRGAGGYGKTTLARALCHDEEIQNAFDDGILWVTLGERPSSSELIAKLSDLIETLGGERPGFTGVEAASTRLRELLADRDILLVLDDVWRAEDARPFLQGGARCARLITTRQAETLPAQAARVQVDAMNSAQATQLLQWGLAAYGLEARLTALAQRLGEWPLLIKLANSMLHKRLGANQPLAAALDSLEGALQKRGLTAFDVRDAQQRQDAVAKTLGVSIDWLEGADRERFFELAVFPEDVYVPIAVLQRLWGGARLDDFEVEELCERLFSTSLLLELDLTQRHVRLHDTIREYLIRRLVPSELSELHRRLLDGYKSTEWHFIETDGYIYTHLAHHLIAAGRKNELQALLLDLRWMQAKLTVSRTRETRADVNALLADYDHSTDIPDVSLVQRAVRMSSHVIGPQPEQLAAQLFGRLGTADSEPVRWLCDRAANVCAAMALVPLRSTLRPPGLEVMTLVGHKASVFGTLLLDEGRRALSWSGDHTLKLWDLQRGKLLRTLSGHDSFVSGACPLNDGHRALSWARDHTLRLWDLQRGELLRTLGGHEGYISGAVLLDEHRHALSWSGDRTLKLWDLQRGELLHTLSGHNSFVSGACPLNEGHRALSWSHDHTLKLWDLQHGELLHTLSGHDGPVYGALLLDEGRRALSWARDHTLKLWDLQRGELLRTLGGHKGYVSGAVLLDEHRRALSWSGNHTLKLWDLQRGELVHTLSGHDGPIYGALLLDEGRRALSWARDHTLKLWDLQHGELLHTLSGHDGPVSGAALLDEGRRALSWSSYDTLKLWDLQRGELLHTLSGHNGSVSGAVLLDAGCRALSWSDDHTIKLWDLQHGELLHTLSGHDGLAIGTALLDEGRRALSWSDDHTIKLWDLQRGELLHTLSGHDNFVYRAVQLDDGRRALSCSEDHTIKLWDLQRGELLHTLSGHDGPVSGAVLLDAGRRALSWSDDYTLKLWDLQRGELLHTFSGHNRAVSGAVLLNEARRALSWSDDYTLKLWDLQRGVLLHTLSGHHRAVSSAVLLNEDLLALSWSYDNTLKLWDLQRGVLLRTLSAHDRAVSGAVLLDENRHALSWSYDNTLKLWDLQRGVLLHTLSGHDDHVIGVVLLDEGRRALSWSADGALKLWDLQRGQLLHTLTGHEGAIQESLPLATNIVLSRSDDRTLRLWDLDAATLLATYHADATITTMAFSEPLGHIFAGDALGHIHLIQLNLPPSAERRQT